MIYERCSLSFDDETSRDLGHETNEPLFGEDSSPIICLAWSCDCGQGRKSRPNIQTKWLSQLESKAISGFHSADGPTDETELSNPRTQFSDNHHLVHYATAAAR